MRLRNYNCVILLVLIISFNFRLYTFFTIPIAFWEYPFYIILALVGTFFLNTMIKYGVLYDLSKPYDVNKRSLLFSVILVNLITFPATQLLFYFSLAFFYYYLGIFYLVLKILVIVIEWKLYHLEFKKYIQEDPIDISLSSKNILSTSVIINILSFLVVETINFCLINAYMYSSYF